MQSTVRNIGFLIALAALRLAPANAQPAFLRRDMQVAGQFGVFAIGVQTGSIETGDFNGDARVDLVVSSDRGLDVLLNVGGGNFGPPIHTDSAQHGALIAADFNGDGKLDLVLPDRGRIIGHVLLGRGDGTFLPPRDLRGAGAAVAGDFDSDGKVDLVVNDGGWLRVLLGNGDATFRPGATIQQAALSYINQLAIADFNGDCRLDLAVNYGIPRNGYSASVLLGNGDGTFLGPTLMRIGAATLLVVDLNGDGLPDLITGYDILLGNGDGSFQAPRAYFTSQSVTPVPFAAADFDGDGHLDLAVGSRYLFAVDNRVLIFQGNGDGTMLPPNQYDVGWQPAVGALADRTETAGPTWSPRIWRRIRCLCCSAVAQEIQA